MTDFLENNDPKKIMILGGNKAQVPLIKAAKDEGYIVVLCDNTKTNPGIALSDIHYEVDFMDKAKILDIAIKENIRGVISNSEAAMENVAFISENCRLEGNTVKSVQTINSKLRFRELQHQIGVYAPDYFLTETFWEALNLSSKLCFPIIIKPARSSGSRGTTKVDSIEQMVQMEENWNECSKYSFDKKVLVEEYIEVPNLDAVIDGDIFVYKNNIIWAGLFTSKRSPLSPMIPMTQIYPIYLQENELNDVKTTISLILNKAGISFGEFNIEMYYTNEKNCFA